jgi:hypothetical protein
MDTGLNVVAQPSLEGLSQLLSSVGFAIYYPGVPNDFSFND